MTSTAERKARAIAARTGITPGPHSPLLQISGRTARSEDEEEVACDDFVATIASRAQVVRLSQRRASHITRGVSDRRYRLYAAAFFFEVKADDGKLTSTQHRFLDAELESGAYALCGTLEDLQRWVMWLQAARSLSHEERLLRGLAYCRNVVQRWALRGYRPEAPARRGQGGA